MTPETEQTAKVVCQQKSHWKPGLSNPDSVHLMVVSIYGAIGWCVHLIGINLNCCEYSEVTYPRIRCLPADKVSHFVSSPSTQTICSHHTLPLFCSIFLLNFSAFLSLLLLFPLQSTLVSMETEHVIAMARTQ